MKRHTVGLLAAATLLACRVSAAEFSLLDLPVKDYRVGFADLWVGKNVDDRKVLLNGQPCTEYLFSHAPSRVVFDIPPGVTSFSAYGIGTTGDKNVVGTWIYIVKVDGKEVFQSKPLVDYPTPQIPIQAAIPAGSKEIELIIDHMKNSFCDHAIWAVPTFH